MITDHASVAIAQTVFYVPAVPLALYICIRNWQNGPRMAWYPLVAFSLIRLAGGITVIVQSYNVDNLGLIIASIVLLNVGLIPLIVSTLFLVRFVFASSFPNNRFTERLGAALRFAILVAVVLLITSGSFISNSGPNVVQVSLSKAAYIIFAVIVYVLLCMLFVLYLRRDRLVANDITYVRVTLFTMPVITLRTAYGLLYVFTSNSITSMWNPLFGSAVAFALMALLPEYIVLLAYGWLGFYRMRTCHHYPGDPELTGLRK